MKIDLGEEIVFEVEIDGTVYQLSEPTTGQIENLREQDQESTEPVFDLLESLGLPKEVSKNLSIRKLKNLIKALVSDIEQKK